MKYDWNYIEQQTQADYESLEMEQQRERAHLALQITIAFGSIWFISGNDMIDIKTGIRLRWDDSCGLFIPNGSQQPPQCV